MGTKAIYNVNSINIDDLNSSSATMKYPVGAKVCIKDEDKAAPDEYIYVKAHENLSLGQPVNVIEGSGGNAEIVTDEFVEIAVGAGELIGYPTTDVTSGHYFWAQISGVITAAAGTVAAGDYVRVIEGGSTVVVDGETGATTRGATSWGLAKTATSGWLATIVVMPGLRSHIAAE